MKAALLALLLVTAPAAAQLVPQPALMVPMIGKRLFAPGGEELGRVVDLVVDAEGRPLAVVADVGGFMGLGIRRVALAWALLRFRDKFVVTRCSDSDYAPNPIRLFPSEP